MAPVKFQICMYTQQCIAAHMRTDSPLRIVFDFRINLGDFKLNVETLMLLFVVYFVTDKMILDH